MLFSKNYINQDRSKQHKQNGAGEQIIQGGSHNAPLVYHSPGSSNCDHCGQGVNRKHAFSPADGNKDVVDHINLCANSATCE